MLILHKYLLSLPLLLLSPVNGRTDYTCPYDTKTYCHTPHPLLMEGQSLLILHQDQIREISCSVVNPQSSRKGHPEGCLESCLIYLRNILKY